MPFLREKPGDFLCVGFCEPADATFDQRSEVECNAQLANPASIFPEAIGEAFDGQFFSACRVHFAKITQREFQRKNETQVTAIQAARQSDLSASRVRKPSPVARVPRVFLRSP